MQEILCQWTSHSQYYSGSHDSIHSILEATLWAWSDTMGLDLWPHTASHTLFWLSCGESVQMECTSECSTQPLHHTGTLTLVFHGLTNSTSVRGSKDSSVKKAQYHRAIEMTLTIICLNQFSPQTFLLTSVHSISMVSIAPTPLSIAGWRQVPVFIQPLSLLPCQLHFSPALSSWPPPGRYAVFPLSPLNSWPEWGVEGEHRVRETHSQVSSTSHLAGCLTNILPSMKADTV